ncbi:hypothetical protein Patl1_11712 [Pistacia atlantica]|uniref:Uncharacterized protein n=1 Tax=Pistacia atlantica TaxID=434234 RepID=A0ACC1A2R1_9ROSI|nr:hypothetical protein Patl1_11712 [Pistacia atlantica]
MVRFLGNNSLSGPLPLQKGVKLQTMQLTIIICVTQNSFIQDIYVFNSLVFITLFPAEIYLSGTFPSWVTTVGMLNLVGNNFTFDSSNSSLVPGLNCLQRNFHCNNNSPRYSRLAIKCGGKQSRVGNTVYEGDNIDGASFGVFNSEKWALSNVGLFSKGRFRTLIQNEGSKVINTTTPDLYQTSRQSPGSLRYYGLGLENGPYNVSLFFAEIVYEDRASRKWESLGRRVFDIYIQGTLCLKDFDISKEAGVVRREIRRSFNATVSDNHLEIHLFWAGKGTCCVLAIGSYGPLISALSVTPGFLPTVDIEQTVNIERKKNQTGLIVGIAVTLAILGFIMIFLVFYMRMKRENNDAEVLLGMGPKPKSFTYAELRSATKDFDPSNKLGKGGFGPVDKVTMSYIYKLTYRYREL